MASARTVTTGAQVFGPQGTAPPVRKEINALIQDKFQFSVYVQALQRFMQVDQKDFLSYYQLSGIHGLPFTAWEGAGGDSGAVNTGYCTHSNVLFPTWHRPYLALYEQLLCKHAVDIANEQGMTGEWKTAAETLRMPYWDWAAKLRPPQEVMTLRTLEISQPDGSTTTMDPNPLYSYHFATRESSFADVDETFRRFSALNTVHGRQITKQTFDLLTKVRDWWGFSTDAADSSTSIATSLEGIHDDIHGTVGGYMGSVPYAAFDPIFWMHHCNVDRVFALWQVLHPDVWVIQSSAGSTGTWTIGPNSQVDVNTPLTPFFNDNTAASNGYWASTDVKLTSTMGYSYPELNTAQASANPRAEMLRIVTNLYGGRVVRNFSSAAESLQQAGIAPPALASARTVAANLNLSSMMPQMMKMAVQKEVPEATASMAIGALAPGLTALVAKPPANVQDAHPAQTVLQKDAGAAAVEESGSGVNNGLTGLLDWTARVRVQKYALDQTFQVCLFLVPDGVENSTISESDCKAWYDSPYFAGQFTAFVNGTHKNMCSSCVDQSERNIVIEGHVPLDEAIMEISGLKSFSEDVVHPYLKKNLVWRCKKANDAVVPLDKIPSLEVSVWSTTLKFDTRVSLDAVLPEWTKPHCHTSITAGQPGGCKDHPHA